MKGMDISLFLHSDIFPRHPQLYGISNHSVPHASKESLQRHQVDQVDTAPAMF